MCCRRDSAPTGKAPYHLSLDSVLTSEASKLIQDSGRMVFHSVADTGGVNTPTPLEVVERFMEEDFATTGDVSGNPSFFYHLGDVVYYAGETQNYFPEFYEPYNKYPGPIFAIPGNHDGDVDPLVNEQSLAALVRNFCATSPVHTPEAKDSPRHAMTQPNVYWTLDTPFATFVGLYSNCPEGGEIRQPQIDWFQSELAQAPNNKALIAAVHHPIFSAYGGEQSNSRSRSQRPRPQRSALHGWFAGQERDLRPWPGRVATIASCTYWRRSSIRRSHPCRCRAQTGRSKASAIRTTDTF